MVTLGDSPRPPSLMHVVEAAYRQASSVEQWLTAVTTAVSETVGDRSVAVVGRAVASNTRQTLCPYVIRAARPDVADALRKQQEDDPARVDVLAGGAGLRRMSRDTTSRDEHFQIMEARFRALGVAEMSHLTVADAGVVCSVGVMHTTPELGGAPRVWRQLAVHLRAGLRLQRRHADVLGALPDGAAVLDPRGHLVEATGQAGASARRELLREAVRNIDRARSSRGLPPGRVLDVWQGLVDGTWSILDRHDSDGRRYIVAVPNEVDVLDPRGLTHQEAQVAALACEGHSDKWIGYTLGIARSTVATHLQTAMEKLGVPSRAALTRTFAPIHQQDAVAS